MITVYGLRNCDTCRKALRWVKTEGIEHRFHDLRSDGLDGSTLANWIEVIGWEALLNRRSSTWRNLADNDKAGVDKTKATALMLANPTLIKRPVFGMDGNVLTGFGEAERRVLKG